jgi:predicted CXXCH cytochrome family protein
VASEAAAATVPHPVLVSGGCVACHDPHGTGQPRMFAQSPQTMCFGCHEPIGKLITASKSQHAPVASRDCSACHNPHGAGVANLLRGAYPADELYVSYQRKHYALCFDCHKAAAFEEEFTVTATGFRDGDRNLHWLHVNKVKGRSCSICHGVHGADQDKLVMSRKPGFGQWDIPIELTRTKTGGGCLVGCHRQVTYDNASPGAKP